MTTLDNAIAQMRAAGMPEFPPGHPRVGVGRITRYGPKKNAWYILHEYRTKAGAYVVVGAYGCWGKIEKCKIEVDWSAMSTEERSELQRAQREAEARERAKKEERQQHAANRAREQWKVATPARDDHPYLLRKHVPAEGLRTFTDGTLVVPMWHWDESAASSRIVGLQKISPEGVKRFTKNMAKEGSAWRIGAVPQPGQTILVAEGVATGLSIRLATGRAHPVFVAFDAGNVVPVVSMLRVRYPDSAIVICADDDWQTTLPDGTPWNPGLDYASRAAMACRAWVCAPVFPDASRRGVKWTDWNDLHVEVSLEAAATQLAEALAQARESFDERKPAQGYEGNPSDSTPPNEAEVAALQSLESIFTPKQPIGEGSDPPSDWANGLMRTDKGAIKPLLHNLVLILRYHHAWRGVLGFDDFSELIVLLKPPPWHDSDRPFARREWTEVDDTRLRLWLSSSFFEAKEKDIMQAVTLVARDKRFHPLVEKIESVEHDGIARVTTMFLDYFGACRGPEFDQASREERDAMVRYTERCAEIFLLGAIARVYKARDPEVTVGEKFDTMLVLEGPQGLRKSSALEALGGEWFTDEKLDIGNRDSLLVLQGRWIIELAEMEGFNKADANAFKQFIPKRQDLFRMPYGRLLVKKARRCVFAGTVNGDSYFKDETGNRRFLPVTCTDIALERLRADAGQIWAEALAMYRAGKAPWWIRKEEQDLFKVEQDKRFEEDVWFQAVQHYCVGRRETTTADVLHEALKVDPGRMDKMGQMRVSTVLRRLGYRRTKIGPKERRVWGFVRPLQEDEQPIGDRDDNAPF
jgi:putative DNA primase/helicase